MYVVLDVMGTLDTGDRAEWHALVNQIKANGHGIVLATGHYGDEEEKNCDFKKEEFSHIFKGANKDDEKYYKYILAYDLRTTIDNLCLIDNDQKNITVAITAGAEKSILFESVSETKRLLQQHNILKNEL